MSPTTVLAAYRVNAREHEAILFLRPRDREREVWDGPRLGPRGAVEKLGVDEAYPIATLYEKLEAWLQKSERLFYTLGADELMDRSLARVFERNRAFDYRGNPAAHPVVQDPLPTIATARLIKDAVEIRALEDAARVSAAGHCRAMQTAAPGQMEFELQAEIEGAFRRLGSKRNGYESIVASGANACVLHYVSNERQMKRNDLVLVDAGAEMNLYTADITRTFPVSGAFTDAQAAVYEIVLKAQKSCDPSSQARTSVERAAQRCGANDHGWSLASSGYSVGTARNSLPRRRTGRGSCMEPAIGSAWMSTTPVGTVMPTAKR